MCRERLRGRREILRRQDEQVGRLNGGEEGVQHGGAEDRDHATSSGQGTTPA